MYVKTVFNFFMIIVPALSTIPEDATLPVPGLIKKYGYDFETHSVITEDGYILTLHRIPRGVEGNGVIKGPVLLAHGSFLSSADWILTGPERALGYVLADAGYDVWMENFRGNRYSRQHLRFSPDRAEFWKFSWHEMGVLDLPATLDYILNNTKQSSLDYIGHSQGTRIFYVMCSEKPEYNAKIRLHMSLAPTVYVDHISSSVMQSFSYVEPALKKLNLNLEILPQFPLDLSFCQTIIGQPLCMEIFRKINDVNEKELEPSVVPVIMGHSPAGSSLKQYLHYTQIIRSGKFRQWDAGVFGNMVLYNNSTPPEYVLEHVTAPGYLFYSRSDKLSAEIDVDRLANRLPNVRGKILIPEYQHMDYLYANNASKTVYKLLLEIMDLKI